MTKLKAGIIGTGFSASFHLEAINRLGNIEVVAISASTIEKAEKAASQFNIPKYYGNAEELIDDPEVEVIHNCTPNHLHYTVNKAVLKAGKHLLAEKPLTLNSEESKELSDLAEQQDVISGICFNYRFFPLVAQAKELIKNKTYGTPRLVYGGYLQDWCLYDTDYSWRMDPEINGPSRAIADIGSHWCDTVQYIIGKKIVKVFADLKTVHQIRKKPKKEVKTFNESNLEEAEDVNIFNEDYGSVLVHFEDGIQGVFTVSQVSAGRKNKLHFDIAAERGTISWNQEQPNRLWIGQRDKANRELTKDPSLLSENAAALSHYPGGHQEGWPDGLKNLMIDFYGAVTKKKHNIPTEGTYSFSTIQEGHHTMQLIEAIVESHKSEKWVQLYDERVESK